MKAFLFAANWKMYLSTRQELEFFNQHKQELFELAQTKNIAIFPSFTSLPAITQASKEKNLHVGAQDCSNHQKGAYTGQVSAQSLAELGCSYGIVGHSERSIFGETADIIAQKAARLIEYALCPIICVGETEEEYNNKQTIAVITKQLQPVLDLLTTYQNPHFCVAYEPVWSIGTGKVPNLEELSIVIHYLHALVQEKYSSQCVILYGGSVTSDISGQLATIPELGGFLIGGASLDFQEFKKIVLY